MSKKVADSSALALLQHVWDHMGDHSSWRRINSSMQAALACAIAARLRFHPGDFQEIYSRFNAGYWIGESGEYSVYAAACKLNHLSACVAWETHRGRKPFYWQGKRLYVGADFRCEGEHVRLTSFGPDQIIACSYTHVDDAVTGLRIESRIHRRYVISRAALRAAQKGK